MAKKKGGNGEDGGLSKMSMVREALGDLGANAKPKELAEYISKKFGAEVNPQMISAYKSTINGGGSAGRSRSGRNGGGGNVSISDIEAVRGLVDRIGGRQL